MTLVSAAFAALMPVQMDALNSTDYPLGSTKHLLPTSKRVSVAVFSAASAQKLAQPVHFNPSTYREKVGAPV
jgi:hypothetical protein